VEEVRVHPPHAALGRCSGRDAGLHALGQPVERTQIAAFVEIRYSSRAMASDVRARSIGSCESSA